MPREGAHDSGDEGQEDIPATQPRPGNWYGVNGGEDRKQEDDTLTIMARLPRAQRSQPSEDEEEAGGRDNGDQQSMEPRQRRGARSVSPTQAFEAWSPHEEESRGSRSRSRRCRRRATNDEEAPDPDEYEHGNGQASDVIDEMINDIYREEDDRVDYQR